MIKAKKIIPPPEFLDSDITYKKNKFIAWTYEFELFERRIKCKAEELRMYDDLEEVESLSDSNWYVEWFLN